MIARAIYLYILPSKYGIILLFIHYFDMRRFPILTYFLKFLSKYGLRLLA